MWVPYSVKCAGFFQGWGVERECDQASYMTPRRPIFSSYLPSDREGVIKHVQRELFPPDAITKAGRPLKVVICDPNRPDQVRTMVVSSPKMKEVLTVLEQVAPTNETVLFLGETGTGKNWLAWLLHTFSKRRERPFVELNVSQHPDGLLESVLFGHEKGAFTGAFEAQPGRIALAEGGTLFINEAGDLSLTSQLKLLRFLDDRVYERVGGSVTHLANVRVIAATHRDLHALVKEGKFREDLYYRLNVVRIMVPPLRERAEEIPAMAEVMLKEISQINDKPWLRWAPEALELLALRIWTGNVRALRNLIIYAVVMSKGEILGPDDITPRLGMELAEGDAEMVSVSLEDDKRRRFLRAYQAGAGNRSAIARILGTCRAEVRRKIRQYGLEKESASEGWIRR